MRMLFVPEPFPEGVLLVLDQANQFCVLAFQCVCVCVCVGISGNSESTTEPDLR